MLDENECDTSVEFRRIEQVLIILNNLSFDDENAQFMSNKCTTLFEFLILCLYVKPLNNSFVELRRNSLDILCNISRKMQLKQLSETHRNLLLISLHYLIVGQDLNTKATRIFLQNENDLEKARKDYALAAKHIYSIENKKIEVGF